MANLFHIRYILSAVKNNIKKNSGTKMYRDSANDLFELITLMTDDYDEYANRGRKTWREQYNSLLFVVEKMILDQEK